MFGIAGSAMAAGAIFSLLFANSCIKKIYFCLITALSLHGIRPRATQLISHAALFLLAILQEALHGEDDFPYIVRNLARLVVSPPRVG